MHFEKNKRSNRAGELKYRDLITIESLFQAWEEFRRGKKKRKDVQIFELFLEDNLFKLHSELKSKTYKHSSYHAFYVQDPKLRHIHKASVADRVLHHLLYTYLYPLFNPTFIFDSYSCRLEKGTHKGVLRLSQIVRKVSRNYTRECWTLKLDIKKFFASVDHQILKNILASKIADKDILWLLSEIIDSFPSGIPLGNLTSQIFANIYLNELDQFIKHSLKIKYYLRYADDFLILSGDNQSLQRLTVTIEEFLQNKLKLELHPNKIVIRKLEWGIDFLGYIILPHYILPRTKTKKRIFQKLKIKVHDENFNQSLQSYLGYLSHASSFRLSQKLKNQIWLWKVKD